MRVPLWLHVYTCTFVQMKLNSFITAPVEGKAFDMTHFGRVVWSRVESSWFKYQRSEVTIERKIITNDQLSNQWNDQTQTTNIAQCFSSNTSLTGILLLLMLVFQQVVKFWNAAGATKLINSKKQWLKKQKQKNNNINLSNVLQILLKVRSSWSTLHTKLQAKNSQAGSTAQPAIVTGLEGLKHHYFPQIGAIKIFFFRTVSNFTIKTLLVHAGLFWHFHNPSNKQ